MPDPVTQSTTVDLSDAPGDWTNQSLDELFSAEPVTAPPQAAPTEPPPTTAPASPTPAAAEEAFLKGAASVYKTREAAVEGVNSKDALIEQLRTQYRLATGHDPITRAPINEVVEDNFATNPEVYYKALSAAKTPTDLVAVQQRFILDTLRPVIPAIATATRAQATRQLESELPEFNAFYNSPEYKKVLEAVPMIKEAIEMAESDIKLHPKLGELYKTAFLVSKGIQLPELLKQNSAPNPTAGRPTATPSMTTMPTTTTTSQAATLRTAEGRKAIISNFENKYKGNLPI